MHRNEDVNELVRDLEDYLNAPESALENTAANEAEARREENAATQESPAEAETVSATPEGSTDEHTPEETAAELEPDLNAELENLKDQLARARAEHYNLSQEYAAYVRRTKSEQAAFKEEGRAQVLSSLLGVLDDIYAAQQAGDLSGPFASIANKLLSTLKNNYGLEIYGEAGEHFDPELHEALMAQSAPVETETVGQVLQPGYRLGEKVLRPTKVIVHNPQ